MMWPWFQNLSVVSGGGGGSLILDQVTTGLEVAFSVGRKLKDGYSGSAIRIRRSNDNAEQDIGFDGSGNTDQSAIASFVGANSAYVVKIYDQHGSRDAIATDSTKQARIVNAGTIETANSQVCMDMGGATSGASFYQPASGNFVDGSTQQLAFLVIRTPGTVSTAVVCGGGTNNSQMLGLDSTSVYYRCTGTAAGLGSWNIGTVPTLSRICAVFRRNETATDLWSDVASAGATDTLGTNVTNTITTLGSYPGGTYPFTGKFMEYIVFSAASVPDDTDRVTVSDDIDAYWAVV